MIYSPHTFELTLIIDSDKFQKFKKKAYKNAEKNHRIYPDNKRMGVNIDLALKDKGIKIEYHDGTYKKKIKFIVNPTKVLGGDDVKKLWKPNKDNIYKLLHKLGKCINRYFNSKYELNNFKLTRMDFTVNIDVGDSKTVAAYIKVLRNIGKVKGFAPKYSDDDIGIEKDLSFDLEGNSNGIEFTAYDKEAESKRKDAKGILRVEVRLTKQKAIRVYTDESDTSKQIMNLALNSRAVFLDIFAHVVPYGNYYKKKDVVKIIEENVLKKIPKEKMLRLLELIPKKKSLYLAQKEMNDRNIDKVIKMFEELNVSPVTISKRHDVKYLKNLYNFLLTENKK